MRDLIDNLGLLQVQIGSLERKSTRVKNQQKYARKQNKVETLATW